MRGVSFAQEDFDGTLCYRVVKELNKLKPLFMKLNGADCEIAMCDAYYHAMTHYKKDKGNLTAYLKRLAETIEKNNNREIPTDFTDPKNIVELEKVRLQTGESNEIKLNPSLDMSAKRGRELVISLALQDMFYFSRLCNAILHSEFGGSQIYFPKPFKTVCLRLQQQIPDFMAICLDVYQKYGAGFDKFLSDEGNIGTWRELDMGLISRSKARIKLMNAVDSEVACADPDTESWYVVGNMSGKKIVKVEYKSLYDYVMELVDSDKTNALKYCIEDSYIFRSIGGSISCVNVSLFTQYDNFICELITNIIYDLGCKYIMQGSKCLYFLVSENTELKIPYRCIRGIELDLSVVGV